MDKDVRELLKNLLDKCDRLSEEECKIISELSNKVDDLGTYIPADGKMFYFVTASGGVGSKYNRRNACENYVKAGNCYRTRKMAVFASERQKVIQKLKELSNRKLIPEWNKGTRYSVTYNTIVGEISIMASKYVSTGTEIYFATREDAAAAVDVIGLERLKKYFFLINESTAHNQDATAAG